MNMNILVLTFMGTSSTEGIAGSTLSLVLHSSHQTLRSPVNSVGDGVVGWYVSGGVRWSFWNNQTGQVEFFVFFLGEVRELVDGQGEFVSVHSVVKVDIFALFLPDGISVS